jgi:rhamnosyltransferase
VRLLPRLAKQEVDGGFEICAIDSSSRDRSRTLLAEAGASVVTIAKEEFRHGATRNRCAERAKGEILVFLSQDVEPVDEHFLAELARAFDDPRVAGAYARVLPRPDDDALTQRTVLELPEASEEEHSRDLDVVGGVWNLSPSERAEYLRFNDVASAIRADVFREIPFPDVAFGEDFAWAARALTAGWRIRFAPRAVVWHAHRYGPRQAFERYRVDAAFHRQIHGHQVRPDWVSAARGFLYEVRQDLRFLRTRRATRRAIDYLRSPVLRGAQVLGQYAGSHGWRERDSAPLVRGR